MALWKSRINEWRRQEDEIAKRIDADEVRREWMNRPFVVGEGTVSLLFVEGRLEGRIVPGRYDVDGPLSRWKEGDTATTIVMIDTGGLVFELPFEGLVTKEHVPVSVRVRVVLRLSDDEAAPERFWRQVIRDQGTYSKSNLASSIGPVVREQLSSWCATRSVEEFGADASIRNELESLVQGCLRRELDRIGFSLVSATLLECRTGLDGVRAGHGEVFIDGQAEDLERRRLEIRQRTRERMLDDRLHELSVDELLKEELDALATREALRERDVTRLREEIEADATDLRNERQQDRDRRRVEHEHEIDTKKRAHQRDEARRDQEDANRSQVDEAKTQAEVGRIEATAQAEEMKLKQELLRGTIGLKRQWEEQREQLKSVEQQREIEAEGKRAEIESGRLQSLDQVSLATKLAHLGDAEALAELARIEASRSLSPDQLLMIAAEKSPAVAQALIERYRHEGRSLKDMQDTMQQRIDKEAHSGRSEADRLERIVAQLLDMVTRVDTERAKASGGRAAGDPTIITGVQGTPVVIHPPKPDPGTT